MVGGLVIVGIAFIIPPVISRAVIKPVRGVSLQSGASANCDKILRNQLVFQRGASVQDEGGSVSSVPSVVEMVFSSYSVEVDIRPPEAGFAPSGAALFS